MTMPVTLRQAQDDKVIYQGDKRIVMVPPSVMMFPVVMVSLSNHDDASHPSTSSG
jgi:hypothetical protein